MSFYVIFGEIMLRHVILEFGSLIKSGVPQNELLRHIW